MNSTSTPMVRDSAEGIETFILNNATDATSKRLAHLENAGLSIHPAAIKDQPDVGLILKDLRLDGNLHESKRLACAVQSQLMAVTRTHRNRGVKQALFHVLLGADMPSVLVEAGFLTSANDRKRVLSPHGRRAMGAAITRAVEQYRQAKFDSKLLAQLSRCKVN